MKNTFIKITEKEILWPNSIFREASVSLPVLMLVWKHFCLDDELSITACYLEVAHLVPNHQSFRKTLQRLTDKLLLELRPSKIKKKPKDNNNRKKFSQSLFRTLNVPIDLS